jgi:chaperonin GroES
VLRVIRNKVLVKLDEPPVKTPGGILFNSNWQTPAGSGTVVSVGPGLVNRRGVRIPVDVNVGQRVAFRWLDGKEIEWQGGIYKVLNDDELHGVCHE